MSKQSSVDWLINFITEDHMIKAKSLKEWLEAFKQAKEMHKEESINLTKHWYNQWEQGKGMTTSEYYDQEFNNK